jgi:glycosyltransferase involved in cell wall biosynthesis
VKVSVVIPLFNKRRHIQRAVGSVLGQTCPDLEIIVVDDGSTDGGGEIVRHTADPRVRLVRQQNAGAAAARNRGVQEASSELVAFLDADDEWRPEFLETVVGLYERHPEAGMFATAYRFQEGERTWRPVFVDCPDSPRGGLLADFFRSLMGPTPVTASSVMMTKQVLSRAGLFPTGIRRGEDLHTWVRIALRYRVAWSPIEGAIYHLSADNRACVDVPLTLDIGVAPAVEAFLQSNEPSVSTRRQVEEYLAYARLEHAQSCFLFGKRGWTLSLLAKTRGTRQFRLKRWILMSLVRFPVPVVKLALAARRTICRRPSHTSPPCIQTS